MKLTILSSVGTLFIYMIVGFAAGKLRWTGEGAVNTLAGLLMKIFLPCAIFASMLRSGGEDLMRDSLLILVTGVIGVGLSTAGCGLLAKKLPVPKGSKGMWAFVSMIANAGFVGLPVAQAVWGEDGLFLAAVLNCAFGFYTYSIGVKFVSADAERAVGIKWKNILLNHAFIAMVAGFAVFLLRIPVSAPAADLIRSLGNCSTPLSMIVSGILISEGKFGEILRDWTALSAAVVRTFLIPLLVLPVMKWLPYPPGSLVPAVTIVLFAMPAPTVGVIFGEEYGSDSRLAANAIFLSSVLSVVSIPLFVFLALN